MAPENIGRLATVKAKDDFYAFIDGWCGRIVGTESGCYWLALETAENGQLVEKRFLVEPDQLEIEL